MDMEGEVQGSHQEAEEEAWQVRSGYDFELVVFLVVEDREKAPEAVVVEPAEHDEWARIVRMVVVVRFWVVSKENAKEESGVRAGSLVLVVEMAIAPLVVLSLLLVAVLLVSLAPWMLAPVLEILLALSVVLEDAPQVLARAHSTMV